MTFCGNFYNLSYIPLVAVPNIPLVAVPNIPLVAVLNVRPIAKVLMANSITEVIFHILHYFEITVFYIISNSHLVIVKNSLITDWR